MFICRKKYETKQNVLSYRIYLYFHDYKLALKIDENGHNGKNIDYKIKKQKAIEQKLCCKFIRIDSEKEYFNIFRANNEIFRLIKQSTKETVTNKISTRFLRSKFKLDNTIKSKAMKFIAKKILPNSK